MIKYRNLPFIIMFILAVLLTGITDFTTVGFDPERLLSAGFWLNLGAVTVANILGLLGSTLMTINKIIYPVDTDKHHGVNEKKVSNKQKLQHQLSEDILKYEDEIRSVIDTSSDTDIDIWIKEVNKDRKIRAWKQNINKKLLKSSREKRKQKLLNYLQNEYINKNIEYLKVKYHKLSKTMLLTGYYNAQEDEDLDIGRGASKMLYDLSPKFILSISASIIISSFAFDLQNGITIAAAINVIVKLSSLFMNVFNGMNYAPRYVKEKIIGDLLKRLEWFKKYFKWKIAKKPLE